MAVSDGWHPVGRMIRDAFAGRPPSADGSWERQCPWRPGIFGIIAFTGHAVLCVPDDWTDASLRALRPDGYGGAADPRVIVALAGTDGFIDSLDTIFAAPGVGGDARLEPRSDLAGHPRAKRAADLRDGVQVFGLPGRDSAVVTVARGIGGLPELSFELDETARGRGLGNEMLWAARTLAGPDDVLIASVSPGNVASTRAVLAAGFLPVAGVQLFRPADVP
ncbi:N-acetyltransferase [Flexivirga meconopsidis]|uniref:N-acetyltransferase n=1 Tax=Flexivirga meconopsidis TaxID=2977121 RepID=UPI002240B7EA|nr:N-acetyltransferase [Flexivirga meconopsidis]